MTDEEQWRAAVAVERAILFDNTKLRRKALGIRGKCKAAKDKDIQDEFKDMFNLGEKRTWL